MADTLIIWCFCLLFFIETALGWGAVGHRLTCNIAQRFMTPKTLAQVHGLVSPGSIQEACTWADHIKSNPQYNWSHKLHYISGHVDKDSLVCSLDGNRDCDQGQCVVEAIRNYTRQLVEGNTNHNRPLNLLIENNQILMRNDRLNAISRYQTHEAIKFLVHFIGDVHQPLHLCSLYRGGNEYKVKFDNRTTVRGWNGHYFPMNLHVLWDEVMLEKIIKLDFHGCHECFLDEIVRYIHQDTNSQDWMDCQSDESSAELGKYSVCPLTWSLPSQKINCESIWVGVDGFNVDLGAEYYDRSKKLLVMQLAKAGFRMGTVLNNIFDSQN